MTLRKSLLALSLSSAFAAFGGSCEYSFGWFKNNAVADFPVPLTLDETTLEGFSYAGFAAADGSDLRVKVKGTDDPLPFEIEKWTPGGKSLVWVKVPNFSKDTVLTLEWGDASAAAAEGAVWDSHSRGVFHFAGSPTLDSANGICTDADGASPITYNGDIGPYASFNGKATLRRFSAAAPAVYGTITNQFTYSFWTRTSTLNQTYVCQWGVNNDQKALLYGYTSAMFTMWSINERNYDGSLPEIKVGLPSTDWHHFAVTYDGATCTVYVDGYVKKQTACTFAWKAWDHAQPFTLGGNYGAEDPFYGDLDEFRMDDVCRSAEWIRASVETQSHSFGGGGLFVKLPPTGASATLTNFPAYVALDANSTGNEYGSYADSINAGMLGVHSALTSEKLPHEVVCSRNDGFYPGCAGVWTLVDRYPPEGLKLRLTFTTDSSKFDCWLPAGESSSSEEATEAAKVFTTNESLFVWHLNPTGAVVDVVNGVPVRPRYANGSDNDDRGYPRGAESPFGPYQGIYCRTNVTQRNSDAVSLPDASVTNVWTLSWWGKSDEFGASKPETYVFVFGNLQFLSGAGYLSGGADCVYCLTYRGDTRTPYGDDLWHFYAFTSDGKKMRSYRDGELVKTCSSTYNLNMANGVSFASGMINLGSSGNTCKDAFIGRMAEVRFETVCRDEDWLKGCAAQRAFREDGTARTCVPHFAVPGVSVVSGANSATFSADLSCRERAGVALCWGATDGGNTFAAWDHVVALGTVDEGAVQGTVNNLAADTAIFARLVATNSYGTAWSKTVRAQTPAPRRGKWAEISVAYDGEETLSDFPLCVRLPASLGLPADSSRVTFALMDGTPLAWEAEKWNPAGESTVWVKIPALAAGTKLRVLWKDSYASGGAWNCAQVWGKDDYARVMHFTCRGSSQYAYESSGWGADVVANSMKSVATNGLAGDARGFTMASDGTYNDSAADFFDFPRGFTMSFWADIAIDTETHTEARWAAGSEHMIKYELAHSSGEPYNQLYVIYSDRTKADGSVKLGFFNNNSGSFAPYFAQFSQYKDTLNRLSDFSAIPRPGDGWHHYAYSHDGDWFSAYCDGELVRRVYWPFNLSQYGVPGGTKMQTNYGSNINHYNHFYGSLDEYRMERRPRSAAWIKATYDNLKPTSSFATVSDARSIGTALIVR